MLWCQLNSPGHVPRQSVDADGWQMFKSFERMSVVSMMSMSHCLRCEEQVLADQEAEQSANNQNAEDQAMKYETRKIFDITNAVKLDDSAVR